MVIVRRILISAILALAALVTSWYFINNYFNRKLPTTQSASIIKNAAPLKPFNLSDTNGNPFTQKSLRGHWNLLFFGYMTCPDICPKTLGLIRDTWSLYNPHKPAPVRFVFVNISPIAFPDDRLKTFLSNYNQDFIGIGGPTKEVKLLSDQLGIYYQQLNDRIDHSTSLMLLDPQGRLRAVFTPPFIAHEIVSDLELLTKI